MKFLATTTLLAAFLLILPVLASAQNVLSTTSLSTEIFDDGFVGTDPAFAGTGFCFDAEACTNLFVGNALVGIGGSSDSQPYGGVSEFTNTSPTAAIGVFDPPYDYFDSGFETSFSSPLGVTLHQSAYALSSSADQFFVFELCAENTSGGDLDIYLGYFADWDAGDFLQNLGDVDGNLVYVWDDSGVTTAFYGFAPIDDGATLSGWHVSSATSDAGQFMEMTTDDPGGEAPNDRRAVMGTDAGTVANGDTACANYAWAAGNDLADLQDAIAAAEASIVAVAIEPGPDGLPGTHNLSAVYPNPFNPQANFTLEVAEQQSVRIAVYDALGREVATLFNGTLTAGTEHAFVIDGAGLPSGVYMVRATGEQFTAVRRVTLMK